MNIQDYSYFYKQNFEYKGLESIFQDKFDQNGINLLYNMLKFSPKKRIDPLNAIQSCYFDEIRDKITNINQMLIL